MKQTKYSTEPPLPEMAERRLRAQGLDPRDPEIRAAAARWVARIRQRNLEKAIERALTEPDLPDEDDWV